LGRADIGHDTNNKIVPFGALHMTGPAQVAPVQGTPRKRN
jgi:hypothetical protein